MPYVPKESKRYWSSLGDKFSGRQTETSVSRAETFFPDVVTDYSVIWWDSQQKKFPPYELPRQLNGYACCPRMTEGDTKHSHREHSSACVSCPKDVCLTRSTDSPYAPFSTGFAGIVTAAMLCLCKYSRKKKKNTKSVRIFDISNIFQIGFAVQYDSH